MGRVKPLKTDGVKPHFISDKYKQQLSSFMNHLAETTASTQHLNTCHCPK